MGLSIPDCVKEFCAVKAEGHMTTKVYFPPSDEVLLKTFSAVSELRDRDPEAFKLFWVALGTGCRRSEAVDLTKTSFVELDGNLWIGAGLGKDGRQIQIPVINWPVHPGCELVPSTLIRGWLAEPRELLFEGLEWERHDALPKRLNAWLAAHGWADEKKMHGLRVYIGCVLYRRNPRLAQRYLRHKSIATTETFYSHFLALTEVVDFKQ
jgi:integrase